MAKGEYVLYGAPHSYFTAKARCYLLVKGLSFSEILSSLRVYKKIIKPRTGLRFIPVIITPEDEVLQDTAAMIPELERRHPERPIMPEDPSLSLAALLLELFADDWMLPHAMHFRWDFPEDNAHYLRDMFGKTIMPNMPRFVRRMAAKKVVARFSKFAPALGVNPDTAPALEAQMKEMLGWLETHFEKHPYLLGGRPSLADIAFTGPFHGHMAIDPYPKRMLKDNYPGIMNWVDRMRKQAPDEGDSAESLPETIKPFLKLMFDAQLPNLQLTEERTIAWLAEHPGEHVPRGVGKGEYRVGETVARKFLQPYLIWRWQRIADYYQTLDDTARPAVDDMLKSVGGLDALQRKPGLRLVKKGTHLVVDSHE